MIIMFLMILLATMASVAIVFWAAYLMAQFGGNKKIIVNAKNDFTFPNQQCNAFWINNHPKSKY